MKSFYADFLWHPGLRHRQRISVIATQGSNLKVLFSRKKCVSPSTVMLVIARALVNELAILVMDEATSTAWRK